LWIHEHFYIVIAVVAYIALFLVWLAFLWLRPLWLYRINEALKPYTDLTLPAWLLSLKAPIRYVLLVGCFHYSPRILDAWIAKSIATARDEFEKKDTVRDRRVHVPVPVVTDGQTVANLTAAHLQPTFGKNRVCLLIWGEGGAGKTSLACQVARWAMLEDPPCASVSSTSCYLC